MVRVKTLHLRQSSPVIVSRNIPKKNLGRYEPYLFRGDVVYIRPDTVRRIRTAQSRTQAQGRGLVAAPGGRDPTRVETETFIIRDDYRGGGRKTRTRKNSTESGGFNDPIKMDMEIRVTGTQEERDRAYKKLVDTVGEAFPFLNRGGETNARVGRKRTGKKGSARVEVTKAKLNNRNKSSMANAIRFELLGELG